MPKYDYRCDCGYEKEWSHSVAACDLNWYCPECGTVMHRVIKKAPVAVFLGPGFACNDGVARGNVGRNPHNQNRYSDGA